MNHHLPDNEKQTWMRVQKKIEEKVSSQQFTTWFEGLKLIKFNANYAYILAPNSYCKEWIENNYMDVLLSALSNVTKTNCKVKLILDSKKSNPPVQSDKRSLSEEPLFI